MNLLPPHPFSEKKIMQEVLGTASRLRSFDTTRTAYKTTCPTILRCCWKIFTELQNSNKTEMDVQTHSNTRPIIVVLLNMFFAAGTCLPSRCLATVGVYTCRHIQ
jgi:hypothetical protein